MSLLRTINLWPRLVVAVTLGFLVLFAVLGVLILRVVDQSQDCILKERMLIARMAARWAMACLTSRFHPFLSEG